MTVAGPLARMAIVVDEYVDAISGIAVAVNDVVTIIWETSSDFRLCIRTAHGTTIRVPPAVVRLALEPLPADGPRIVCGTVSLPGILHHDAVWASAAKEEIAAGSCSVVPTPLLLEPGLPSMVWPVTPAAFKTDFWATSRLLVVHATGSRLTELASAFDGFDVLQMLRSAVRVVVWMKGRLGKMHFLDASPEVAAAAYDAGHSLYFNPPLDVQRRFIAAIAEELGIGMRGGRWAPQSADGGGADVVGGDIEVFAVRGRHSTPWHYDAQANFTVQVRGTKRWSVVLPCTGAAVCSDNAFQPSGVTQQRVDEPYSNLHPSSSNSSALLVDAALHSLCSRGPAPAMAGQVVSFALRPGSTLFLPAGVWHRVDAEDDDSGSLSINLSLSGTRWSDVILSRITPALWADRLLRSRVGFPVAEATVSRSDPASRASVRYACAAALQRMRDIIGKLTPDDIMPPAMLEAGDDDDMDDDDEEVGGDSTAFTREHAAASAGVNDAGVDSDECKPRFSFVETGNDVVAAPDAILDVAFSRSPLTAVFEWPLLASTQTSGMPDVPVAASSSSSASFRILSGFGGVDGTVGKPQLRVRIDVSGKRLVSLLRLIAGAPCGVNFTFRTVHTAVPSHTEPTRSTCSQQVGSTPGVKPTSVAVSSGITASDLVSDIEAPAADLAKLLLRIGVVRRSADSESLL